MAYSLTETDKQIAEELQNAIPAMARGQARVVRVSRSAIDFQRRSAIGAMRMVQSTTAPPAPIDPTRHGERIEEALGFGHVHSGGHGEGTAVARTGKDSFGSAVAMVDGPGQSMAVVAEGACGSSSAWTSYAGRATAWVEADATGDADASCYGSGRAEARVATGTCGSAYARTRGEGIAFAHSRAAGRVLAECIGTGEIIVDQWSNADFEIVLRSQRKIKVIHFCQVRLSAEITRGGTLDLCFGQMCHLRRPVPPDSQVIAIHSPAEIDFQ